MPIFIFGVSVMNSKPFQPLKLFLPLALTFVTPQFAFSEEDEVELDKTIVTGSLIILREGDLASPVHSYTRDDIAASAANTTNGLLRNLEFNTGAEINSDPFTQNSSAGTSQVNLRGLGLASTLTLLNDRRTTLSGAYAIDGANFVDINTIPMIAIERIEILKDGASAIYGSDAIAGVVNFKTRNDFSGYEFSVSNQSTTRDGQADNSAGFIWGHQDGVVSAMFAVEYFDRSPLETTERDYTEGTGISTLGSPGAFIPLGVIDAASPYKPFEGLAPAGTPYRDSECENAGGTPDSALPFGTCNIDYLSYSYLIADETRIQSVGTFDYQLNADHTLFSELWFANSDSKFRTAPSFANLSFPVVPADNPGNLAANGGFGTSVVYLGRPLVGNAGGQINERNSQTYRILLGSEGYLNQNWRYDTAYQYSQNRFEFVGTDTLIDRFNAALNGTGGPNNNEYFNPFSSAYLDSSLANSQSVIDDFLQDYSHEVTTELHTLDGTVTAPLFALPNGDVNTAFGFQYRKETNDQVADDNLEALNFAFVSGTQSSEGDREVYALFSEFSLPLHEKVNMQTAARAETYPDTDDSTINPKLGIRWEATQDMIVRGSASTAFRAPSLQQQANSTVAVEQIGTGFVPIVTVPNSDLDPETAFIRNIGAEFNTDIGFSTNFDYWYFDYKDIIIQESAEAIFAADPNDPRIVYDTNTNRITRVNVQFINASSVKTSGIDWGIKQVINTSHGIYLASLNTTWMEQYKLKESDSSEEIDAVGSRNGLNIARSLPEWRSNLSLNFSRNHHSTTWFTRYVSDYDDDANNDKTIADQFTHDLTYSYRYLGFGSLETEFALGVFNMFDRDPPAVEAVLGYDTKIHDPRGRMVSAGVTIRY